MLAALLAPLLLLPLATMGQQKSNCPANFVQLGKKCYYFSTDKKNFDGATGDCWGRGGKLAEPKSAEEQSLISAVGYPVGSSTFVNSFPGGFWLGLNDRAKYPNFSFVYASTNTPITFSAFSPGEPDGDGQCVHLWYVGDYPKVSPTTGTWNDWYCELPLNYICEAPATCTGALTCSYI